MSDEKCKTCWYGPNSCTTESGKSCCVFDRPKADFIQPEDESTPCGLPEKDGQVAESRLAADAHKAMQYIYKVAGGPTDEARDAVSLIQAQQLSIDALTTQLAEAKAIDEELAQLAKEQQKVNIEMVGATKLLLQQLSAVQAENERLKVRLKNACEELRGE